MYLTNPCYILKTASDNYNNYENKTHLYCVLSSVMCLCPRTLSLLISHEYFPFQRRTPRLRQVKQLVQSHIVTGLWPESSAPRAGAD